MLVFDAKKRVPARLTMSALETCAASELEVCLHSIEHGIVILDGDSFLPCAVQECILDCKHDFSATVQPITCFSISLLYWQDGTPWTAACPFIATCPMLPCFPQGHVGHHEVGRERCHWTQPKIIQGVELCSMSFFSWKCTLPFDQ